MKLEKLGFYFAEAVVEMQPVCFQDCDWSDKDWPCLCGDAKSRRLRRKGCSHCHGSKVGLAHSDQFRATAASHTTRLTQIPGGVSRAIKSLHPVYSQLGPAHNEAADPKRESPPPGGPRGSPGGLLLLLLFLLFVLLLLPLILVVPLSIIIFIFILLIHSFTPFFSFSPFFPLNFPLSPPPFSPLFSVLLLLASF